MSFQQDDDDNVDYDDGEEMESISLSWKFCVEKEIEKFVKRLVFINALNFAFLCSSKQPASQQTSTLLSTFYGNWNYFFSFLYSLTLNKIQLTRQVTVVLFS